MTIEIVDGPHIAAGESVSDAVDCTKGRLVRVTMPSAWTPALLTLLISSDGTFFNDVVDMQGNAIAINVEPGSAVIVPEQLGTAAEFLKFRSGTVTNPVPQADVRNFAVAVDVVVAVTQSQRG